jgi:hypothetical protein
MKGGEDLLTKEEKEHLIEVEKTGEKAGEEEKPKDAGCECGKKKGESYHGQQK